MCLVYLGPGVCHTVLQLLENKREMFQDQNSSLSCKGYGFIHHLENRKQSNVARKDQDCSTGNTASLSALPVPHDYT